MGQFHTQDYRPQDLPALITFIYSIRQPEELHQFPTGVHLEEVMAKPSIRSLTRLWKDEAAAIVGYAYIDPIFCNLYFEVDPRLDSTALQREMITWGIETFKQVKRAGKCGQDAMLDTNCNEKNVTRIALLTSMGFHPQDLMTLHMSRSLSASIPAITLPPGFSIRPVTGETEADEIAALYNAAYGTGNTHREDILTIMRTSSYDREMDLVAVSPDGRLVGLCSCGYEAKLNEKSPRKLGWTDPVLVHPDFQKMGLARGMIWSGWKKLKKHGIEVAELSTSSQNQKGIAAFSKAGYVIDERWFWFSNPVE